MGEIVVSLHFFDWLIVFAYIGFMLLVGFYFSRKKGDFDDYFMAGRSLTAPLLVGTLVSTFYGLDTLFEEVPFWEGVSAFFAYSLPYTLLYVVMAFLAPKFKEKFPDGTTMQEITLKKYGRLAGFCSSIAAFVYSTNTIEMVAIGVIIHLVAGLPLWVGVLLGAVVVVIYTWTGGLWAVTMTDFFQFISMMVCTGLALIIAWRAIGGYENVYRGIVSFVEIMEYDPPYEEAAGYFFKPGAGYLTPWTLVAYSLTALSVLCEPAFFQRIFASAGPKEVKKAFLAGVPMWLAFDWVTTFLGICAAAAVGLGTLPILEGREALFAVCGQYLPVGLMGLFTAGVLACAMSTADSYFLVSGGVIGYDLYKGIFKPDATPEKVKRMTKIGVVISAIISIILSFSIDSIIGLWTFQATFILSVTLVPVYFGTFSRKAPKKIAGTMAAVTGLALAIIWYAVFITAGFMDDDVGTVMLTIGNLELWMDYGILVIPPITLVVYLLGSAFGKKTMPEAIKEAN